MTPLCQCGCGLPAGVWKKTYARFGVKKGDPLKFIQGHQWKKDLAKMYTVDSVTGCWNWIGNIEWGYGRLAHRLAYRIYYEAAKGPTPAGTQLDHLCRNRACVNPAHLEAVIPAVNVRRGRSTKLSAADVADIRRLYAEGATNVEIAARYPIGTTQASRIRRGESWAVA